mgnify:CR=1 FL=1
MSKAVEFLNEKQPCQSTRDVPVAEQGFRQESDVNVSSSDIKNMTDMVETERAEHSTTAVRGNMQDQQHWQQMKDWMSIYI